ncbi:MAG TPA: MMPL family transporter [Gaiellaceae bacterium]|nr:MMPL family transporter [Gaiellaceae bacterium]
MASRGAGYAPPHAAGRPGGWTIGALASLVVTLRYPILAAWAAGAALAVLYLPAVGEGGAADYEGLVAQGSEAVAAERRAAQLFDLPLPARALVVQRDPNGLSRPALEAAVDRAAAVSSGEVPALREIALALPLANVDRLVPASREEGTTAVTYLFFPRDAGLSTQAELSRAYLARIPPAEAPVGVTGTAPARYDQWRAIADSIRWVELGTLVLVVLVFGLAFRAPGAPLLVLAAAGLAYVVSTRLVAWTGQQLGTAAPREIEPLALALLLGLVTDYAAFYMTGTRRRLADGDDRVTAARATARAYGPIVTTAGLIVALGTATMALARLEFFRAFAPGLALTVLVTLAVGMTFVPAALAVFGWSVFAPAAFREDAEQQAPPAWRTWLVRLATFRPVSAVVVVAVVAALVVAARPVADMRLGFALVEAHERDAEPRRASEAAGTGFAPGIVSPTVLILEGRGLDRQRRALDRFGELIRERPGIAAVIGPADVPRELPVDVFVSENGVGARLVVVLEDEPLNAEAIETVRALRDDAPELLERAGLGARIVGVGGDTAIAEETVSQLGRDFRVVAVAAILVNLLLLALFLRAVVAPLYLVAASVLSLAASLGITTWVFQTHFGFTDLTYYVPFAVAVLSLSLGSDYNLFVVGRIWQEASRRRLRDAVCYAAPRSARALAIAGFTLAGSFGVLAVIPLRPFREFAFAMALGVLLDTFVVRPFLVPALVALFGRHGWWPRTPPEPVER